MTDVSNLDNLAAAIATSSSKIRNYAVAQAAATQAQEADFQAKIAALDARLDVLEGGSPPPPPPPPTTHLTGVHWPGTSEFQALKQAGYGFAIVTAFDVAEAKVKLDAAKAAGIKLVIGPYPEPYTYAGSAWTISAAGVAMLDYLETRASEVVALFVFNEPYWAMGLGAAELRSLRTKIRSVWPGAKVYHDIGHPSRWAPGGDLAQGDKWADQTGVADYAGIWDYPFKTSGYSKAAPLARLATECAFAKDSMGAVPVFLGQSHSYPGDGLAYPTDVQMKDWNDSIRAALPANALISWYVWRQSIYPDYLANHPAQWPLTVA